MANTSVTAFWLLPTLLLTSQVHADWECVKGFRDTTDAERSTMTQVLETAKAALPGAPDGWIIGGYEEISVRQSTCMDDETTPWSYNISRTYNRTDNVDEREATEQAYAADMQAAQAAKQPRIDALMAKAQALGAEQGTAAARGDFARAEQINLEIDALSKELDRVLDEGDPQAQADALAAATLQDVEMSISVSVNQGAIFDPAMEAAPAPANTRSAFRWQVTDGGITRAHALLLFGRWRPRAAGGVESDFSGDASPAVASAVAIHAIADPGRLDALLAGIDLSAIAALLP